MGEFVNAIYTPFLIGVDYSFSIGVGIEFVSVFFKDFSQVFKIVYFTIKNYENRLVFIMNRLSSPFAKIDDA